MICLRLRIELPPSTTTDCAYDIRKHDVYPDVEGLEEHDALLRKCRKCNRGCDAEAVLRFGKGRALSTTEVLGKHG